MGQSHFGLVEAKYLIQERSGDLNDWHPAQKKRKKKGKEKEEKEKSPFSVFFSHSIISFIICKKRERAKERKEKEKEK